MFVVFALCFVSVDTAFMPVLSMSGHRPSLVLILLAFVALYASRPAALAAALLVGAYADVRVPAIFPQGGMYVIGPHMLATVVAVWILLEVREALIRKSVLTVAAASLVLTLAQSLVFLAVAGLRLVYADPAPLWGAGSGAQAFGHDAIDALYTALLGIPVAWCLLRTTGAWGFQDAGPRFGHR
jgi:rod shape-determining protein MreD